MKLLTNPILKKLINGFYVLFLFLVILGKYELIFNGNYPVRKAIWTLWSFASFTMVLFYGSIIFKKGQNKSKLKAVSFVVFVFCGMSVWARLAPDISKNDERQFLKNDFQNFEKIFLIKNDIFKKHPDIYNASYITTVRQNNYWQIKNLVGDFLDYNVSEYDANGRLRNLADDNEISVIDFSATEIKYYFNGCSNLILIRKDSFSQMTTNQESIDNNYFIEEKQQESN